MKQLLLVLSFTVSSLAFANVELPDFVKNSDQTVVTEVSEKGAVLNPELGGNEIYRDPKQVSVIEEKNQEKKTVEPLPTVGADDLIEDRDDQELPPLPTIGQSLADPNFEKTLDPKVTVLSKHENELISLPPGVDRNVVADATITVIDGKFLKERSFGKISKTVTVKKDKDPQQFYNFSLSYNNLDPKIIDSLKYSTLDLALEYSAKGSDLRDLEAKLNNLLLTRYGLLFAKAEIKDPPLDTGSSLVLINFSGTKINRVILKNLSELSIEKVKEEFNTIKSGMYLISSVTELPVLDFAIKYKLRPRIDYRPVRDDPGMIDVIITIPANA